MLKQLGFSQINFRTLRLQQVLKAGFGAAIAIIAALGIGLLNAPSAGIVTLLTIQNTRRETFKLIALRLLGFVLATTLAWLAFTLVGFDAWGFGVFVILFVGLANLFGLEDAISMNAVLATHYLIWGEINLGLVANEAGLLGVGMGIGVLLNLLMPRALPYIKDGQAKIDSQISDNLCRIASLLRGQTTPLHFEELELRMEQTTADALEAAGNTSDQYVRYLNAYLAMRRQQIVVLKQMAERIPNDLLLLPQNLSLAMFMEEVAAEFSEDNDAHDLLERWSLLRDAYRQQPLPSSRKEFEQRAGLLQILEDLRYFLRLKQQFYSQWPQRNAPRDIY